MTRFHKLKNRLYATNQLETGAKMSLYYNMKMCCGDTTVHGKYDFCYEHSKYSMVIN